MSNLLINEYPLLVLPKLATKTGLNQAIVLQQVHFWIQQSAHEYEGRKWIYNTYTDWGEQFPFWSDKTIKRTIKSLEDQNLLIIGNYNKKRYDNTKWYTINYEEIKRLENEEEAHGQNGHGWSKRPSGGGQNDQGVWSKRPSGGGQNDQTYTRDYTETTTENTNIYFYVVQYLNDMAGRNFKHTTQKTKGQINGRLNDGYTVEDMKNVIDYKVQEWKGHKKMEEYLRPATLFGTKFENYYDQMRRNQPKRQEPKQNEAERLSDEERERAKQEALRGL